MREDGWEVIIGLEIHVQLSTKTKLFSRAPNAFGCEPNENIDVVDTATPGALPVLNKEAVRLATLFGLAIDAKVQRFSKFDRKSYFYPDCPRNFQITQLDQPILIGGSVDIVVEKEKKSIAIDRAHLEDDAGKLNHIANGSLVDYNRAGAPLIEIVSEPVIRSATEAAAYGKAVKAIMEYIGASECNMEEGMLRMDVNISVRRQGEEALRPKSEIKNMNSFTYMQIAIDAEVKRQIALYEASPDKAPEELVTQSTYRFDVERCEVVLMREKESADDYRYFPEPDLPPLVLQEAFIEKCREELPELPAMRYKRYIEEYKLSEYAADVLVSDKKLSDQFDLASRHSSNPISLNNWMCVEFVGRLKEKNLELTSSGIDPLHIAQLVELIETKTITGKIAKKIADEMVEKPGISAQEIYESNPDYKPLTDLSIIEPLVDEVLSSNPQAIVDFKAGREKAFQALVGQVMGKTKGKADPAVVKEIMLKKINA